MKNTRLIGGVSIVFLLLPNFAAAVAPTAEEMQEARQRSASHFEGDSGKNDPFFSFTYDGKPSAELLGAWETTRASRRLDNHRTERTLTYADPKTGLQVRCVAVEYAVFPAVEWVLYLSNTGGKETPVLERIYPLDLRIKSRGKEGFTVHHSLGDSNSGRSFAPVEDVLTAEKPGPLVLAPNGGRSSDPHLPYFNVDWRTGGVAAAVGWSGQWEAGFEAGPDGDLRLRAGQQLTRLKLYPGETIRTPRILLVFWNGRNALRGNNLFRQLTLAHYLPRRQGALVLPPICASVGWVEEDGSYEKPHVAAMKPFAERGIEVFWSDMDPQQWYPKGFPEGTGTWEPDPVKYPHGLKPVGDAAKAAGLGYLLWFEPERVHPGSKIDREHPEFVMKAQGEWSQLFRLHDEKARKWLTDYIDVQITAAQITWLRWDFNVDPLGFWRRNDAPDRQGITEIRHVEGLYAMWDELRARHPGLNIDNCASGGRRIDLETCSRSLPLWHSDMQCGQCKPAADQLQNGGLFRWIPLHGCGNFDLEPSYRFRSAMTPGNVLVKASFTKRSDDQDRDTAEAVKKTAVVYRQLRPLMLGDFYPLFPHDESESQWYGYQFDNPDLQAGCALLFRREQSPDATKAIRFRGVNPQASYEISNLDEGIPTKISGHDLLEKGLPVSIPDQPGAAVLTYKRETTTPGDRPALPAETEGRSPSRSAGPRPEEMRQRDQWVERRLVDSQAQIPFSFNFGGRASADLLSAWPKTAKTERLDAARTRRTLAWTDPQTGLEIRCVVVEYADFPVVEWTVYFKNAGKEDTPVLSDVRALDDQIGVGPEVACVLHHHAGTTVTAADFQPLTTALPPGKQIELLPSGGRPCGGAWPYFNLQTGTEGRILAVGWPGRWAARFDRRADQGLRVTAGQELVHLKLHPGEEIRTPLIAEQFYRGDWQRAQNVWRRWMLAHNLPRPGGKLPPPQMTPCSSHQFAEMTKADEASQMLFIDRYVEEKIKIDYWWMDAGWYPCDGNWPKTGTWEVDKSRFPRGLRAVSDHARRKGIKTIVWFEPERVAPGTWLAENHPDWLLGGTLLNLGNPQALQWVTGHVSKMITDEGIGLYRQDYNIDPLPFWRNNDAPDRRGMTENAYVTGYLAFWDALRRAHPGMLIDSCASGGHRNDLETMRRAVPLLRSDYIFEPVGQQGHTYGLAYWLPFFGTGEIALDSYLFRSCLCAGNTPCWDVRNKDLNYDLMRKLASEWRAVAPYFFGDYYPLTPYSLANDAWMAWQFDRPEQGDGLVQAFRRAECANESIRLKLHGLEPDAVYTLVNFDEPGATELTGRELCEQGLPLVIKDRPGATVVTYRREKEK